MRIIIVEDEIKIREGMAKLISTNTNHVIVVEASNGKEGFEAIVRFKPDLVITDIRMPEMDGLQMIKKLHEEKMLRHVVILSGYSEFAYAQQAIQYDVAEYLLKPLTADDIQETLEKIEEKIRKEEQTLYGITESHLRAYLLGHIQDEDYQRLKKCCDLGSNTKYELYAGYIGSELLSYRQRVEEAIKTLQEKYKKIKIYLFYWENEQTFYCFLMGGKEYISEMEGFEKDFRKKIFRIYQQADHTAVWAKESFSAFVELKKVRKKVKEYLTYALVMNTNTWLTKDYIDSYTQEQYIAPTSINKKLRSAVCHGDHEKIQQAANEFLQYIQAHQFDAKDVKQAFLKIYFFICDILQDSDKTLYEYLKRTNIKKLLEDAITWKELETAYLDIVIVLTKPEIKREDISNYLIKKVINYIRGNYRDKITLEEVARRYEITPEYLSTLFNREMEINFSTFLKQFRISHAKRLLIGTDKKIYEIAEDIGYGDPKYFARVFKEEIGISPVEYREIREKL
jgi:Response regulator containing CheY-like receiver domain and AraC-type DNA-binding domain